ncbi:MAG: hypothetical protein ChlgKO_14090 [Chlamydiales bacterium]
MRIKVFLLLLLPFFCFGREYQFNQGDQYIYDAKHHISKRNTRCFQIIYDVLSVDVKGTALVSCRFQGQRLAWVAGYQYNVFITSEGKISMEKPWNCCLGKYNQQAQSQVEFYLFPLEFYKKNKGSSFSNVENVHTFEVRQTILCKDFVNTYEVVMDPNDGLPLQFRIWENDWLYFEVNRQDQSE